MRVVTLASRVLRQWFIASRLRLALRVFSSRTSSVKAGSPRTKVIYLKSYMQIEEVE